MKVIGISAYAQSGKDTLCRLLNELRPNTFMPFAFANALKQKVAPFVQELFGWDVFDLTPEQKKLVRPLLVWLGATMREIDPEYWVKIVHDGIQQHCYQYIERPPYWDVKAYPIVTDVRYANEAKFLKEHYDCLIVKIERDGVGPANDEEMWNQPLVEPYVDHWVKWPNTTLENLRPFADEVLRKFDAS